MVVGVLAMNLVLVGHDSYIAVISAKQLPAISSPGDGSEINGCNDKNNCVKSRHARCLINCPLIIFLFVSLPSFPKLD